MSSASHQILGALFSNHGILPIIFEEKRGEVTNQSTHEYLEKLEDRAAQVA